MATYAIINKRTREIEQPKGGLQHEYATMLLRVPDIMLAVFRWNRTLEQTRMILNPRLAPWQEIIEIDI